MKFVTSAYKQKLLEEKKWEYEDKLEAELEKREEKAKQSGGLVGFYSNLLTKNIAYGGDVASSAISAYTAGSQRQEKYLRTNSDIETPPSEGADNIINSSSSSKKEGEGTPRLGEQHTGEERKEEREKEERTHIRDEATRVSSQLESRDTHIKEESGVIISREKAPTTGPIDVVTNKEEVILSARQRYLERKKQKTTTADQSV